MYLVKVLGLGLGQMEFEKKFVKGKVDNPLWQYLTDFVMAVFMRLSHGQG